MAGMESFMYQPGEDPQRTMYRVMFWLGILLNTVLFLWSLAASYFDFQSSWTPYPLAFLGFATLMNIGFYGDYAMNRDLMADTYRFMVLQYFLSGFTLMIASFAFIQIDQGTAYIADNWPVMSQQVIPFTTQLSQQRLFEMLQNGLSWVGWFAALVAVPQMQRAFELLDHKHARFALNPFRVLLPQLGLLFLIAVITVAVGASASIVSTFAHSADESAVIFTITTAVFFIIAIPLAIIVAWVLGTHHTTYTIVWVVFAVLSLFAVCGGSVVSAQAADVDDFTIPRWDFVRMFVPNQYQHKSVEVYVRDAQTLLRGTGLGGVMLFLYGLVLVGTSMHSAFLIAALAPSVSAGPDAIHHAAASLRGGLPDASGDGYGTGSAVATGYYGTLGGGEEGGPSRSKASAAASPRDDDGLDDIQIVDSDEDEEAAAPASRGRTSSRPGEGGYQSDASGTIDGSGMARGKSVTGLELSAKAGEASALSPTARRGGGYGTAASSAADDADAYALDSDSPAKVYTMPSWGEYCQVSANLLRRELGSRLCCVIGSAVYVVIGIGLLAAGVAGLGVASRCGALARGGGYSSRYDVNLPANTNPLVHVNNTFPSGRVRIVAYDGIAANSGTFNVTVRTFSLDATHVYSRAQANASLDFFNTFDPFAVPFTTRLFASVAPLVGMADAAAACDAAEVAIGVPLASINLGAAEAVRDGTHPSVLLRDAADRAHAEVRGVALDDVTTRYVEAPAFDLFATGAATRPGGADSQPALGTPAAAAYARDEILRAEGVRHRAAMDPGAALAERLARLEDPTAVATLPPQVVMASAVASGYGPGGAADRLGVTLPARIGPASRAQGGIYLTTRDSWEQEADAAGSARSAELMAEIQARHGQHPCLRMPLSPADARSWLTLLDARAEAKEALEASSGMAELAAAEDRLRRVQARHDEALEAHLGAPPTMAALGSYRVRTAGAYVDIESSLLFNPPMFSSLYVETETAPMVLIGSLTIPLYGDPNLPPPRPGVFDVEGTAIHVRSRTGDVNMTTLVGPGIDVETGGDTYTQGTVSALVTIAPDNVALAGKGEMRLQGRGTGMVTVTEGLGGYSAKFGTEEGMLLVTNCAGAVGTTVGFESSQGGDIWFTTMILAGGNLTNIRLVGGTLHANVIYSNFVTIDASAGGSTSVLEAFLGLPTLEANVAPPLEGKYVKPGMASNNPKGSISITGIGAAPSANTSEPGVFSSYLKVDLRTTTDPITVQVNGGGFNGPYSVETEHGQTTVEIVGKLGPTSGTLGTVTDANPSFGYVRARSDYGDIDLVQLVNSVPDLSSIGVLV